MMRRALACEPQGLNPRGESRACEFAQVVRVGMFGYIDDGKGVLSLGSIKHPITASIRADVLGKEYLVDPNDTK